MNLIKCNIKFVVIAMVLISVMAFLTGVNAEDIHEITSYSTMDLSVCQDDIDLSPEIDNETTFTNSYNIANDTSDDNLFLNYPTIDKEDAETFKILTLIINNQNLK